MKLPFGVFYNVITKLLHLSERSKFIFEVYCPPKLQLKGGRITYNGPQIGVVADLQSEKLSTETETDI